MVTTRSAVYSPITLHGRRIVLRTMTDQDYDAWYEVRTRCHDWLLKWEPRSAHSSHLAEDHRSFVSRCAIRERERQIGTGFGFGIFVEGRFVGEITLSSIQRGPLQSAYIGYWIDQSVAGQGLMPEAVVTMLQYAFDRCASIASRSISSLATLRLDGSSRSSDCGLKASPSVTLRLMARGKTTPATRSPPKSGAIAHPSSSRTGCYPGTPRRLRRGALVARRVRWGAVNP